ncbi:MAG: SCP2 sterol-binding domain-containing protein [Sneathiella sp.]
MSAPDILSNPPPFSPTLLASFLLRPVPKFIIEKPASLLLHRIQKQHPEIFNRLKPLGICCFCINPTDFHLNFLLKLDHGNPSIEAVETQASHNNADAVISGPLHSLIQLAEGRVDGDALFFSRTLSIEGNTEAILSLRNAVDSEDISLEAIWSEQVGFLQPTAQRFFAKATSLYNRAYGDLDLIQRSITAALPNQVQQIDTDLEFQEKQLRKLEKEIKKLKASRRNSATGTELD